mmetsp:Transcript_80996/g.238069  ORF Transcript_80996/g.238069 Transcript_80996/m.238069 type:complete len:227 (+) Transcript_80996:1510-2190(+)
MWHFVVLLVVAAGLRVLRAAAAAGELRGVAVLPQAVQLALRGLPGLGHYVRFPVVRVAVAVGAIAVPVFGPLPGLVLLVLGDHAGQHGELHASALAVGRHHRLWRQRLPRLRRQERRGVRHPGHEVLPSAGLLHVLAQLPRDDLLLAFFTALLVVHGETTDLLLLLPRASTSVVGLLLHGLLHLLEHHGLEKGSLSIGTLAQGLTQPAILGPELCQLQFVDLLCGL